MKKKGFTLIELLAVIIILAVIAVITTPIVLNIVEDAKNKANKNSAYGIIDGARLYYAESLLDESKITDGTKDILNKLALNGSKPNKGNVYVNSKGQVKVALVYDKVCYTKDFLATDLTESNDIENCAVISTPEEPEVPEKSGLVKTLFKQYSETNTVGLLKENKQTRSAIDNYYYKGTNTEVSNNFVWYEGHLWRVIEFSDNTVTMITQQPITALQPAFVPWTTEQAYKDSYVNKWLNEVFYNSIEDKSKIMQNIFNIGIYTKVSEITTTQYVGLLDEAQYNRAGDNSFLGINDLFWFGNRLDANRGRAGHYDNTKTYAYFSSAYGIRPVIKIEDVQVDSGEGTLTNPFKTDHISTNTSNVKVGEYISVPGDNQYCSTVISGRCLFRVVSKDNDSIKVILNGLLTTTSSFNSSLNPPYFDSGSAILKPLNDFAKTIPTIYRYTNSKAFNTGVLGKSSNVGNDYGNALSKKYYGDVGLPVVGEMFSGNDIDITTGTKTFVNGATIENPTAVDQWFWNMNPANISAGSYSANAIENNGQRNAVGIYNTSPGIRPVIFLNKGETADLTFTSGVGTAENPYILGS